MGVAPLRPGMEFVVSGEFADCPKQRIALRDHHDVAGLHPVAKDERHLDCSGLRGDIRVSLKLPLGFAGIDDCFPIGVLVVTPVDVFEPEQRVTACDGIFE